MELQGFVDVSAVLRCGVYALVKNGVVIYVGKSKSLYQRIYSHRHIAKRAAKGKPVPDWLPTRGFVFDQVFVRLCRLEELDELEAQMINLYKPKYNQSLKVPGKVTTPVTITVRGVGIPLNHVPPPQPELGLKRL